MSIGNRIRFFRNERGMTQKELGQALGFSEKTADIRVAQYEAGTRVPKPILIKHIAEILNVSTDALNIPDIISQLGLMHTLFALEDIHGLKITKVNGMPCLCFDHSSMSAMFYERMFEAWQQQSEKLKNGEITKEEYNKWKYNYPEFDTSSCWIKITDLSSIE